MPRQHFRRDREPSSWIDRALARPWIWVPLAIGSWALLASPVLRVIAALF